MHKNHSMGVPQWWSTANLLYMYRTPILPILGSRTAAVSPAVTQLSRSDASLPCDHACAGVGSRLTRSPPPCQASRRRSRGSAPPRWGPGRHLRPALPRRRTRPHDGRRCRTVFAQPRAVIFGARSIAGVCASQASMHATPMGELNQGRHLCAPAKSAAGCSALAPLA